MNARWDRLVERHPALAPCRGAIEAAYGLMHGTFSAGGQLLVCGNGGSAADSDHLSGELLKAFKRPRHLAPEWSEKLGAELAGHLQGALPALPLPNFTGLLTAFGNDCDGAYGFAQLVWGLGREGDCLLCISTSGNSANVIHAARVAAAKGVRTIGLTGAGGGALAGAVEVCIRAPAGEVYQVQELHLPIYHELCLQLEEAFFGVE